MTRLSERLRPDVEAAQWVIEKVRELEAELDAIRAYMKRHASLQLASYDLEKKECQEAK